jgi:hypothetical protein
MDKNDALMQAMGLSGYCRDLSGVTEQDLIALFQKLESDANAVRSIIQEKLDLFRGQLEQQYTIVFGERSSQSSAEKS